MLQVRELYVLAPLLLVGVCISMVSGCGDGQRPRNPINSLLWKEDTKYAAEYSEHEFRRVRAGVSRDEVVSLLGNPLQISVKSGGRILKLINIVDGREKVVYPDVGPESSLPMTEEVYYYSQPGKSGAWYVRAVSFSTNGVAVNVHKSFYTD